MRFIRCSRCSTPSTPSAIGRASRSLVQRSLHQLRPSSQSNVSLAARPETPNPACTFADVARSTSAGDIESSSSALLFLDNSFEGLAATENTPPLRIMLGSFPLFLGDPTSVLREIHIATRVNHGPQRPDRSSHAQHTIDCCDPSYFSVVAHLSRSALLHFCSRRCQQWSRFTRFAKAVPLAVFERTHMN